MSNFCRRLDLRQMKNYNLLGKLGRHRSYLGRTRRYLSLSAVRSQQNFAPRPQFQNSNFQSSRIRRNEFLLPPPPFGRPPATARFLPEDRSASAQNLSQERLMKIEFRIHAYGRVDPEILDEFLQNLRPEDKITPSNALTVFKCCGSYLPMYSRGKRIELLHKIWDSFQSHGVKYDVSHYNALLHLYLYNEFEFSPFEFLANMEKDKIEPNRVTYQRLIQRFAQIGDLERAGKILEHMKSLDMPINEHVFNSLVYANIKTKNEIGVKDIFEIMKKNEVEKTTDTYLEMMKAYAEIGDLSSIEKILSDESEVLFSDREILETIYFVAKNSHGQHTDKLLGYIKKTPGYKHDAVNSALRINALGDSEVAIKILNTIPRSIGADGQAVNFGDMLIWQAVDMNFDELQIVSLVENLKTADVHKKGYERIYTMAARKSNKKLATTAFTKLISEKSFPIRPNVFYPLIAMNAVDKDLDGLKNSFDLIEKYIGRFELNSLSDFFWPNVDDAVSLAEVGEKFANVPRQKFVSSYVIHQLLKNDKEKILKTIENYSADLYMSSSMIRCIFYYLKLTTDSSTSVALLTKLQENLNNWSILTKPNCLTDTFLRNCVFFFPEDLHLDILRQLSEKGFCGSKYLVNHLNSLSKVLNLNPNVEKYFVKLSENGEKFLNAKYRLPQPPLQDFTTRKDESFKKTDAASIFKECLESKNTTKALEMYKKIKRPSDLITVQLMAVLAQTGDSENLAQVVSTLQRNTGEIVSSILFAISLSNAGKFLAARKVMQPLVGERQFPAILMGYVRYSMRTKDFKNLENLLRSTKGLPKIDREILYKNLLNVYRDTKDFTAATNVWTTMQEENFSPSDELMLILSDIYASNNQQTPFAVQAPIAVDQTPNSLERSPDDRFERFSQRDPHIILQDLLKNPKSESKIVELAKISSAKRRFGPTAALWMYHLIWARYDEAEKILNSSTPIDLTSILSEINLISLCGELKHYGKENVLRYLLEKKIFNQIKPVASKIFYSYLIGINMDREKFGAACDVIKEAEKDGLGVNQLNSAVLARLTVELNRRGLPVPFNLPTARDANREKNLKKSEPIERNETFAAEPTESVKT